MDVVEANDRDLSGNDEADFVESRDGADGRRIVEADDRGKAAFPLEQFACGDVARFAAGGDAFQLRDELRVDANTERSADLHRGVPAGSRIGAERLSLDERDSTVAQLEKMRQRVAGCGEMVELDGEDAFFSAVSGYGNYGYGQQSLKRHIDSNDALDSTRKQQTRILIQELGPVPVADDEIEELLLQQRIFNAAQHRSRVAFADFWHHDADGRALLFPEAARERIRMVVKRRGCLKDALLGGRRDTVLRGRVVHDARDRG